MSQQAPCTSEALVGGVCTVGVGEHMVIPPIPELPLHNCIGSDRKPISKSVP